MANAPPPANDVLHRLQQFFHGLTVNQRLLLAGGAALVGGTLWLFVTLLGQPKYVILYSGLRPEEAQNLASRLAAKNIPHQISADGGSLLVPDDKLDASRLETAAAGLPRSARMGFELFDTPNWAGSDFTEKVNFQRALEGELERTLATLSEVQAVRVHLVLPQESLFTEEQHEAKAAVILKTRSGRLSDQAQQAIPQLVASAVDRLRPENVTVVDADTNTPLLRAAMARMAAPSGSTKSWPRPWFVPLSRSWAPIMCAPACMSNTNWAPAKRPRKLTIRKLPQLSPRSMRKRVPPAARPLAFLAPPATFPSSTPPPVHAGHRRTIDVKVR